MSRLLPDSRARHSSSKQTNSAGCEGCDGHFGLSLSTQGNQYSQIKYKAKDEICSLTSKGQESTYLGFSDKGTLRCLARVRVACVTSEHASQRWDPQTVQYSTATWFSSSSQETANWNCKWEVKPTVDWNLFYPIEPFNPFTFRSTSKASADKKNDMAALSEAFWSLSKSSSNEKFFFRPHTPELPTERRKNISVLLEV